MAFGGGPKLLDIYEARNGTLTSLDQLPHSSKVTDLILEIQQRESS